jgi:hypothetical protein
MNWQEQLICRHQQLFVRSFRGVRFSPAYPRCNDGWRDIVTHLTERVAAASKGSAVQFTQILEQHGALRIHWTSRSELPQEVELAIEKAVGLAEARSVCTCVHCGAEGRLFASDFLLFPACKIHERGIPVEQDHIVGIFLSKEGRRVEIAIARQDVMDLKEVVGRDAENLDQRILNCLRHFSETGFVILAFEHVDFCERHVLVSSSRAAP